LSLFEVLVPAGQKPPAPAHKNIAHDETLYVIEGVLTWTVDGIPEVIGAVAGGPPERERMTDVLRYHGMTVAAPPTAK
jgi:hypothetical protein